MVINYSTDNMVGGSMVYLRVDKYIKDMISIGEQIQKQRKDKKETKYYTKAKGVFLNLTFAMPFILTVLLVFLAEPVTLVDLIKNF